MIEFRLVLAALAGGILFLYVCAGMIRTPRWLVADLLMRTMALSYGVHIVGDLLLGFEAKPYEHVLGLGWLAIFGVLMWLRRRPHFDGESLLVGVILSCAIRFAVDLFANDDDSGLIAGVISTRQLGELTFLVLAGLVYLVRVRRAPANGIAPV